MRKLNMWQRLGIVLSLLWIVAGGIWQRNSDANLADFMAFTTYRDCKDDPPAVPPPGAKTVIDRCATEVQAAHDLVTKGSWGRVADFAFAPVLLGWMLAYLVLWVARWVLAGSKISD